LAAQSFTCAPIRPEHAAESVARPHEWTFALYPGRLVRNFDVDLIDARLRFGVPLSGVPIANLRGRAHDLVDLHAAPLPSRWQAAAAAARELPSEHMMLAVLGSDDVRTDKALVALVRADDLLTRHDCGSKDSI
jgi:hypothetical protein